MKSALMIGTEDRILNPWAHMAKNYGFVPLFGDGSTKYDSNLILWIFYFASKECVLQ